MAQQNKFEDAFFSCRKQCLSLSYIVPTYIQQTFSLFITYLRFHANKITHDYL